MKKFTEMLHLLFKVYLFQKIYFDMKKNPDHRKLTCIYLIGIIYIYIFM